MNIRNLCLSIDLNQPTIPSDAGKIRGYLASHFWGDAYAHQHDADGRLIYRYPRVQYKIIDGSCLLVGFSEGIEVMKRAFLELAELDIAGHKTDIVTKHLAAFDSFFGSSTASYNYSFLTPWLALNQRNYEKYQITGSWPKRMEILKRILVGNLISISKSLGYTVPAPITARLGRIKEVKTSLKGTPMLGFLGDFSVNFDIPDYWGIGKSVSRGFGTVKRIDGAT
jgi:hypothetical protein